MFFNNSKLTTIEKVFLSISYFLRASLLYAMGLGMWYHKWVMVFVSGLALVLTFLPAILEKNYKLTLPTEIELIVVVFIYMSLFLGEIKDYYERYWWWDNLLHTFSGIAFGFIGFIFIYILYKEGKVNTKPVYIAMFVFCFAMAIGGVWEIFEFNMDTHAHTNMQRRETGVFDTMYDLTEDAIGALFVATIGFFYLNGVKGSGLFDKLINRFINKNRHLIQDKKI